MEVEFYIGKGNKACGMMLTVGTFTLVPLQCYQVTGTQLKIGYA